MLEKLLQEIAPLQEKLQNHPIYEEVKDLRDLEVFMKYHVYFVWDFMSLVKFLQHNFAPSTYPWKPVSNSQIAHFINDIVLEEETDHLPNGQIMSHFQMYGMAMNEMGIDTDYINHFIEDFTLESKEAIFKEYLIPIEIKRGIQQTFDFIDPKKPHIAASAFCFGRENIIPKMFQSLLDRFGIQEKDAPLFHYYLSRHIQLDGEVHGPMAIKMVSFTCADNDQKWKEATDAAKKALKARISLWDFILGEILLAKGAGQVKTMTSPEILNREI